MTGFAIAYLGVWFAVALYVTFLGVRQAQLRRTASQLQEQLSQSQPADAPPSAASRAA